MPELLNKENLDMSEPRFLWENPGFYQITEEGGHTTFHFGSYPNKGVLAIRYFVLIAIVTVIFYSGWILGIPTYALVLPFVLITGIITVVVRARQRVYGDTKMELTRQACVIRNSNTQIEIAPLLEVLFQVRSLTRSGRRLSECGDRELFLVTENPSKQRLFFPLARNGLCDRLAKDISVATGCSLRKEFIA